MQCAPFYLLQELEGNNSVLEAIASFLTTLLKASPVLLLGISIACGTVLFIPEDLASKLAITEFRQQYRAYIGGTFILSSSIVLAQFAWLFIQSLKYKYDHRISLSNKRKRLYYLTPDEKAYLVPYVFCDENTQYFLLEDGISGGLEAKGIIYRASNIGNMLDGFAYNIQPWAKHYLKNNPHLLEGANPPPD